jgi:hypothetical protein
VSKQLPAALQPTKSFNKSLTIPYRHLNRGPLYLGAVFTIALHAQCEYAPKTERRKFNEEMVVRSYGVCN